jgi:L-gulonate 5-dehydrogenase
MPPREGGFAQYVAMPERNLVAVPDRLRPDTGGAGRTHRRAAGTPRLGLGAAPQDMHETPW